MAINLIEQLNLFEVSKNYLTQLVKRSGDYNVLYNSYYQLDSNEDADKVTEKLKRFYCECGFGSVEINLVELEDENENDTLNIEYHGPMLDEQYLTDVEEKLQSVIDNIYDDIGCCKKEDIFIKKDCLYKEGKRFKSFGNKKIDIKDSLLP